MRTMIDLATVADDLFESSPPPRSSMARGEVGALIGELMPQGADLLRDRCRGADLLLGWLESFPGDTWQHRWVASGADIGAQRWGLWGPPDATPRLVSRGVTPLIVLDIVRPAPSWFAKATPSHLFETYRQFHEPAVFAELERAIEIEQPTRTAAMLALVALTRIRLHTGVALMELPAEAFGQVVAAYWRHGRRIVSPGLAWRALQTIGGLVGEAPTYHASIHPGPMTIEQLVDRFDVHCRPVRDLLVAYLRERQPSVDHSSLIQLSVSLVRRFWKELEALQPGINDLRLSADVTVAWKNRARYRDDGEPFHGANAVLSAVRTFYLDISQWALDNPVRWGIWAAPSPVSAADTSGANRNTRRRQAEMHQRIRTLTPLLPALVRTAEQQHDDARHVLDTARATPDGNSFEIGNITYQRVERGTFYTDGDRRPALRLANGDIVQAYQREDDAFWTWAIIEVLRHTGIRSEELMELTHLSIRRYTHTDGETIPLLHIAPSKTDSERVLPVSPELASVLAQIIKRVTGPDGRIPIVARYDATERVWLPPQPHLFQRRYGGRPAVFDAGNIRRLLVILANNADLRDIDGQLLRFTPHDFRRIFVTDSVANGLPVHIAQQLLGHLDLNTTRGYLAVYPQQVIDHYRAFIDRRRQRRPADEYRAPTSDEWADFEQHFVLRRVALGTCHRPYGTPCIHEHACVRCPMLHVEPSRRHRLQEIAVNIDERLDEARQNNGHLPGGRTVVMTLDGTAVPR